MTAGRAVPTILIASGGLVPIDPSLLARPAADPDAAAQAADAVARLLAHRRAQRGRPTPGDDADRAFLAAVRALAPDPAVAAALRQGGEEAGRGVYAKAVVDEPLARALATLSAGLRASGLGELHVQNAFHRTATLRHDAPFAAATPFVEGALRGFLAECYNCEAHVHAEGATLDARLGAGRDVNKGNGGQRA